MSYSERRGPNVSEYVANLNAIPSAQDVQNASGDPFNLDDELAMFTNTQFFDFDAGAAPASSDDLHLGGFTSDEPTAPTQKESTVPEMDFLNGA